MTNRLTLTGTTLTVLLCREADSILSTPISQVEATFEGLIGEKHSGFTRPADSRTPYYTRGTPIRNTRQVSIISAEEMAAGRRQPGHPGDLAGMDRSQLAAGRYPAPRPNSRQTPD